MIAQQREPGVESQAAFEDPRGFLDFADYLKGKAKFFLFLVYGFPSLALRID